MEPVRKTVIWPPDAGRAWDADERRLLDQLSPDVLPRHVAVIMDGNGRWARSKGWSERIRGHEAGVEAVRDTTRTCAMLGIGFLTLYAFSEENWQRPKHEISALMRLLERFTIDERDELMENGVRLHTIGNLDKLPDSTRRELAKTVEMTAQNSGTTLVLALSYGARDEIIRAVRRAFRDVACGEIAPEAIDESSFRAWLDTADYPDPDLLIRTSGELRISNFLLWQIAYAELFVTPVLWPDFRRRHLLEILVDYTHRDRRFGRVSDPDAPRAPNGDASAS